MALYNDVSSLRKLYETRPAHKWSGTQTFQCGHWTESSTVDSWILMAVDPFDIYKTKKDYRQALKEGLWSDLEEHHASTCFTLQWVDVDRSGPKKDESSTIKDVLKDACFEYAELPDPETFWTSNAPPKVYPENVLGHALPYIFVPESRLAGLEGLVWKMPSESLFTGPSLQYVFRRRPSYSPQLWSFHITVTSRPEISTMKPSALFEMNDASYWIKNQYDQKLLFNPCVPREPVILEPRLKAMLDGHDEVVKKPESIQVSEAFDSESTDISHEDEEPKALETPTVLEPPKAPKIRFVFKDASKPASKSLRDHCFETLWEFK